LPGLENVNDILSEKFFSLDIRVCLTQVYFGIATLKDAFHETSNLLRLAAYPDNRGAIVFYQTIGLNKLLLETNNPSALRKIYRSKFSPLIEYDLKNNSVLMQTLKAYVMCDCNIEEAPARCISIKTRCGTA
jgi:DNA-binding PucR family transcriptional regulator